MVTFADDFDRADGGLGANWITWSSALSILSNQVAPPTTALHGAIYITLCDSNDNFSKITVATVAGQFRCACRRTDSSNYYMVNRNSTTLTLSKVVAAALTPLASTSVTFIAGDTLEVRAVGNLITAHVNGVQVLSATDSDLPTGKSVGFAGSASTSLRLDSWSGGDVPATAGAIYGRVRCARRPGARGRSNRMGW